MTTITPQDRKAAAAFFRDGRTDLAVKLRLGFNAEPLLEAFALHRLRTIEECAKIADRHDTGDCSREDMGARRIAAEIRGLGV